MGAWNPSISDNRGTFPCILLYFLLGSAGDADGMNQWKEQIWVSVLSNPSLFSEKFPSGNFTWVLQDKAKPSLFNKPWPGQADPVGFGVEKKKSGDASIEELQLSLRAALSLRSSSAVVYMSLLQALQRGLEQGLCSRRSSRSWVPSHIPPGG